MNKKFNIVILSYLFIFVSVLESSPTNDNVKANKNKLSIIHLSKCLDKTDIGGLSLVRAKILDKDDSIEIHCSLKIDSPELIYSNVRVGVCVNSISIEVPFHKEVINGAACDVVNLGVTFNKADLERFKKNPDDPTRPIISISGSIEARIGGQSSSFYNLLDFESVALMYNETHQE